MGQKATQLRGELRELVKTHMPEGFLGAFTDDPADLEVAQQFCRTLAERNLLCLSWPKEFGGGDASPWEQTVVREEMWAHHEPRGAQYMGVNWVGPAIMRHGTADQQRTHLPPIARGEVIWCQGTSPRAIGGRWVRCWSAVPCRMIAGPTQFTPMYWAPRGSWWAHISSRTTVCSQGDAPRPPNSSGQAAHSSPRAASVRQNAWATARSAGSSVNAPR